MATKKTKPTKASKKAPAVIFRNSLNGVIIGNDGAKSISLTDPRAWEEILLGYIEEGQGLQMLFREVPWLYRGVTLRMQALGGMPFAIMKGEKEFDTSQNYENKLGVLPDPGRLFSLIEGAMTLFNYAYVFKKRNVRRTLGLRYLNPESITPKIAPVAGLMSFERQLGGRKMPLDVEDLIYFWGTDPFVEIGHPTSSPAQSALLAAGVIHSMDTWAEKHLRSGLVKKTVFAVSGSVPEGERLRLREWLRRTMADGAKGAGEEEIEVLNSDKVNPTVIGEGFKELADVDLTKGKREDIATALGVPQSKLFSNAASYATKVGDDASFLEDTILPEAEFIEQTLNDQFFMAPEMKAEGLRFKFLPESLNAFQEEEVNRANAFASLSQYLPPALSAQILGMELPAGVTWDQVTAMAAEYMASKPAQSASLPVRTQQKSEEPSELHRELIRWRHKAMKRFKDSKGKRAQVEFESEHINPVLAEAIRGSLDVAASRDDIDRVFKQAEQWENYP